MQQSIMRTFGVAICYLFLFGSPRTQVEVSEYRRVTLGPRVAAVVIPQAQGYSEIPSRFPGVFDKQSKCARGGIPIPQLLLASGGVVHHPVFIGRIILGEVEKGVEYKLWLRPRALEGFDVVSIPAFIAELQSMGSSDVGEDIAPVVVVLDEITLRKANTIGLPSIRIDSIHRDRGHGVVLSSTAQHTLDSAYPGREIIDC